jgi:arylsulfatase A-like enzyme
VIEDQVRLMDVAPTILGLVGVAPPSAFGAGDVAHRERDLTPWLTDRAGDRFPELIAFSELTLLGWPQFSVRTRTRKAIFTGRRDVRTEEYDLVADPGERRDLAQGSDRSPALARLSAEHGAWLAHWSQRPPLAREATLDAQHVARLRALGYIE